MGAPELPSDPVEEDLRAAAYIQHAVISSDDSDSEIEVIEDYQQLPIHDEDDYLDVVVNDIEEEVIVAALETSHHLDYSNTSTNNFVPVEHMDINIEQKIWNEPRPAELQLELDKNATTQILNAMANFTLPNVCIPEWATIIPEERWKEELLERIRKQ